MLRDSCHFLKVDLDGLIQTYSTLHKDTAELFADAKLKPLFVLSDERRALFSQPLNYMGLVLREFEIMRKWAAKMGSLQTNAKDFYLYSMVTRLRESTGEYHMDELMDKLA